MDDSVSESKILGDKLFGIEIVVDKHPETAQARLEAHESCEAIIADLRSQLEAAQREIQEWRDASVTEQKAIDTFVAKWKARLEASKNRERAERTKREEAERELQTLKNSTLREVVDKYGPEEHQRKLREIFNAEQRTQKYQNEADDWEVRATNAERRLGEALVAFENAARFGHERHRDGLRFEECKWDFCVSARAVLASQTEEKE